MYIKSLYLLIDQVFTYSNDKLYMAFIQLCFPTYVSECWQDYIWVLK